MIYLQDKRNMLTGYKDMSNLIGMFEKFGKKTVHVDTLLDKISATQTT